MRQWERGKYRRRDQNVGERGANRSKARGRKDDRPRIEDKAKEPPISRKAFSFFA